MRLLGPSIFLIGCPLSILYSLKAALRAPDRICAVLALAVSAGVPATMLIMSALGAS